MMFYAKFSASTARTLAALAVIGVVTSAAADTIPPVPRTLKDIVNEATAVFVGVPNRITYIGYDRRSPEDFGREFKDQGAGRMIVYEVAVKRVLYPERTQLLQRMLAGPAARLGREPPQLEIGKAYVFFLSRPS